MNRSGVHHGFCQMCGVQTRECRLMQVAKIIDEPVSSSIEQLLFYFRMLKSESQSEDENSVRQNPKLQHELDENICLECISVLSSLMQFSARKATNKTTPQQGSRHEGGATDNVGQSTETISELPQASAGEKLVLPTQANLQASSCSSTGDFQNRESLLQLSSESPVAKSPSPSKLCLNNKTEELQKTADAAMKSSIDSACTKVVDDGPSTQSSPVRETRSSVGSPTDSATNLSPSPIHLPRDTSLTDDDSISPKLNLTQSPLTLSPKRTIPRLKLFQDTVEDSTSSTTISAKTLRDHELKKVVNSSPTKENAPDQPTPDNISDSDSWVSTSSHDLSFATDYSNYKVTAPQNSPVITEEAADSRSSIDENGEQTLKGILKSDESPSPRTARNIQFDPMKSIRLIFDEESSSEDEKSKNESQNDSLQQNNVSILQTNSTIKSKNVSTDILDGSLETEFSRHTEKVTISLSSNKSAWRSSRTNENVKRKIQDFHDLLHTDGVVTEKLCDDATLDLKLPSVADKDLFTPSADASKKPSNTRNTSPTKPILKAKRRHPVKNLGLRNVKSKINVSDSSGQSSTEIESSMDSDNLPTSKRKSKRSTPQEKSPESNESSHSSKLDLVPDDEKLVASKCEQDALKTNNGSEYVLKGKDLGYVKDEMQKLTNRIFCAYVDMGVRCDEILPSVTSDSDKKSERSKTKRKNVDSHTSSKSKKKKC